jgi:hypothetical protein
MAREFSDFPEPEVLGHRVFRSPPLTPRCENVESSPSRHTASTSYEVSCLNVVGLLLSEPVSSKWRLLIEVFGTFATESSKKRVC